MLYVGAQDVGAVRLQAPVFHVHDVVRVGDEDRYGRLGDRLAQRRGVVHGEVLAAPLLVQIRLRAFGYPASPLKTLYLVSVQVR